MFCPSCGHKLNSQTNCSYCNIELVYIEGNVIIKEHYDEVRKVHDSMNKFILMSEDSLKTLKSYVENDDFIYELDDENKLNNILSDVTSSKNSLLDYRDSIVELLNDSKRIDYLRSMNYIFGNIDDDINKSLSLIENFLDYFNIFTNKIENYGMNYSNKDTETITVEEFHSEIDAINKNMDDVQELFSKQLKQQDIYEELRNNNEARKTFKKEINDTLTSLNKFDKKLDENLEPRQLKQLKMFDNQYGNIEEKMLKCKSKMRETIKILEQCLSIIDNIEKPEINENIKLNNKRIIDL